MNVFNRRSSDKYIHNRRIRPHTRMLNDRMICLAATLLYELELVSLEHLVGLVELMCKIDIFGAYEHYTLDVKKVGLLYSPRIFSAVYWCRTGAHQSIYQWMPWIWYIWYLLAMGSPIVINKSFQFPKTCWMWFRLLALRGTVYSIYNWVQTA